MCTTAAQQILKMVVLTFLLLPRQQQQQQAQPQKQQQHHPPTPQSWQYKAQKHKRHVAAMSKLILGHIVHPPPTFFVGNPSLQQSRNNDMGWGVA